MILGLFLGQSAQAWGAIAAGAASVIALGIATVPPAIRHSRRPRLGFSVCSGEPWIRTLETKPVATTSCRVEISNTGGYTAHSVEAKVQAWRFRQTPDAAWHDSGVDPIHLRWISIPEAGRLDRPYGAKIDLAPQGRDFVEILRFQLGTPAELALDDSSLVEGTTWHKSPWVDAEHEVQFMLTADNVEAETRTIRVLIASGGRLKEFEIL